MEEKKIIRVAQVIGHAGAGGVESCIMNYYKHIDKTKVQFDFLVENTCPIIDKSIIESMGGKVIIIPSYKNVFKYIKTLTKIFKENNYDIVHSNMNALSVFTLKAAKKAKIKVRIAHSHSTSNKKEWKKNIIKNLLRPFSKKYATHYFACSEHAGRWLFGNKTFDKGLVTIINNAIELDRFFFNQDYRDLIRKEYNIENKFVIGHVGRFMPQKNHNFLIDVFYEVQKKRNNAVLLLIGDGPLLDEIKTKVSKLNIEDKVIFAGVHSDIEKYYNAMDLFLFPSLYEGLGMTLVEAQVNGLNCIASNTIPKDAIISNFTKIVNLDYSLWDNEIIKFTGRDNHIDTQIINKFDIENECKKIEDFYENFL